MSEESAVDYQIAVYGAAGALGREILIALEGEGLPIAGLTAIGRAESASQEVFWKGRPQPLVVHGAFDISAIDVAVLATPSEAANAIRQELMDGDILVIDHSVGATETGKLPLVWPNLGLDALEDHPGGFAVPGATAAVIAEFLALLDGFADIDAVDATVLLGATSAGQRGAEALSSQTVSLLGQRLTEEGPFGGVLAFNLLVGSKDMQGQTDPFERQTAAQVAQLLDEIEPEQLRLRALQIPVFSGVALSLVVRLADDTLELDRLIAKLESHSGFLYIPGRFMLRDCHDNDAIFVGDLRLQADGTLSVIMAMDGIHRTAQAVGTLLSHVIENDLW
jgi:aspartate-semialdehyde dehydrogenase